MTYQDVEPDNRSEFEKIIHDLQREARKANKEDLEKAQILGGLVKHPAWPVFEAMLNKRLQTFSDQLLSPLMRMDAVLSQEWLKGAMSGMIIARDLPAVIIAATQELRPAAADDDGDGQ